MVELRYLTRSLVLFLLTIHVLVLCLTSALSVDCGLGLIMMVHPFYTAAKWMVIVQKMACSVLC